MSEQAFDVDDFRARWEATGGQYEVCAEYDPASRYVCIREKGHAEPHPWHREGSVEDREPLHAELAELRRKRERLSAFVQEYARDDCYDPVGGDTEDCGECVPCRARAALRSTENPFDEHTQMWAEEWRSTENPEAR